MIPFRRHCFAPLLALLALLVLLALLPLVALSCSTTRTTKTTPPTPDARAAVLLAGGTVLEGSDHVFVTDDSVFVATESFAAVTGFRRAPEGLCREALCIPLPPDGSWQRRYDDRDYLNLTAFAQHTGRALIRAGDRELWSMSDAGKDGNIAITGGAAPDFALPDRKGAIRRLSDFRGKKVLLLTWASW